MGRVIKMQKWEYKTLRAYRGDVVQIDGSDPGQGGRARPKFPQYLNVLGGEGWEVVEYLLDGPDTNGQSAFEVLLRRSLA
jgi:hypothetical protein